MESDRINLRKHEAVISPVVGNGKDLSGAKELKNATPVWRWFFLVLLGAFGLYIGLIVLDTRLAPQEFPQAMGHEGLGSEACPAVPRRSSDGIKEHLPQPSYGRGECACTPVRYFVIMSMQRSGSGWFETLLNDHPNISSHGEIFSVKPRRKNFTTIEETLNAVYSLEWKSSAAKNECTSAVGHKWMLNQGLMEYNREIGAYYKERGVSIVFLLRRNLLKRLVSVLANGYDRRVKPLNGTHKSHVHFPEEAKVLAEFKPIINIENLRANLQRVQELTEDALHFFNGTRLCVLYYEDLVKDPKTILKVEEFLGVPSRDLSSKQVKIHTKPLPDQIENWEEVSKTLNGTEFESFLTENDYA